ncbi:MAG: MFS transporter [Ahrensia sp.]|nr:MFS transporter [Ahrensia sp.]
MLHFLKANARWVAGGFLLVFFSSFGQTFFISIWGAEIRADYGLSHGGFGAIYMIGTLASAMTLPFLGRIVDRFSVANCAVFVMLMLSAATLLMAFGDGIVVLALTIYMLRLFGQGMMIHVAMTAMGRWYAANRGKAVSMSSTGINVAEAIMPSLFVLLATQMNWRSTWMVACVTLMVVALPVIYLLMKRERMPASRGDADAVVAATRHWTRKEVLRDPLFWASGLGVFAPAFIGTSIFFHQDYLIEFNNWPPELYYRSFALMALTTVSVSLLTGLAVDRWSAVQILPFFMIPLGFGCLLLGSGGQTYTIVVFMVLLGCSYGITTTLFGALWPELYGTQNLGSIRSITIAIMVFLTAAGPGVTGLFIDLGVTFNRQLIVMGLYCLSTIAILTMTSRRFRLRMEADVAKIAPPE